MKVINLLLYLILYLTPIGINAQSGKEIQEWQSAVIQLENPVDTVGWSVGWFNKTETSETPKFISQNLRKRGTALYILYKGKRYLVTARHILFDENKAKADYDVIKNQYLNEPDSLNKSFLLSKLDFDSTKIHLNIFRVPTLDEYNKFGSPENGLMLFGAGPEWIRQYTFSDSSVDLSVISLNRDGQGKRFAKDLENKEYVPVNIDNFDLEPEIGAEIFTIGFPEPISSYGKIDLSIAESNWKSSYVNVPIISFGRISMKNDSLDYYWGNIDIFPGNSGGPVVSNGNLIGFIISQPYIEAERKDDKLATDYIIRIPFAKIIKLKYLRDILERQRLKDSEFMKLQQGR